MADPNFNIDKNGYIVDPMIKLKPRPMIEQGAMTKIHGIIVHQTDSSTAEATLASYDRAGANGAHFLIAKNGTVYQVASLYQKTHHVGHLQKKCLESHTCPPAELKAVPGFNPSVTHKIEMRKQPPLRFPSNEDSIGIEIVGMCILDPKYIKSGMTKEQVELVRRDKGVYETPTPAQTLALRTLVGKLEVGLNIASDEVFRHPRVSYKNKTEAGKAEWDKNQ